MTNRRSLFAACLLAALVAGSCGGGGDGDKAAPAVPTTGPQAEVKLKVGGVYSPAATLRADLTQLLQEHVFLAGAATNLLLQGKDPAPAAAVLEANTAALASNFERVYDDAVAQRFLELWRRKAGLFVEFARAAAAGDEPAQAKLKGDLGLWQEEFAKFLNETNPHLAADDMKEDAGTHVNAFISAVTAHAKKDPLALGKLKDAAEVMPRTAAIYAAGIVKQKPNEFAGTADGPGATLLATLTATLREHVHLLGANTRVVVAGGDAKKHREVLDENSEGLANLFGALYGDAEARRFLQVWRRHVGSFFDYAKATAARDAAAMQKAATDLERFRGDLGAFLASVNPNLPAQAMAADFEDYVAAVIALIGAQAGGEPAEFQRLHEAAATTPLLAELIAGGISKQFDTKFG